MKIEKKGKIVTVSFEVDETGQPSATGKSLVNFSTGGFKPVPGSNLKINLTVITPLKSAQAA